MIFHVVLKITDIYAHIDVKIGCSDHYDTNLTRFRRRRYVVLSSTINNVISYKLAQGVHYHMALLALYRIRCHNLRKHPLTRGSCDFHKISLFYGAAMLPKICSRRPPCCRRWVTSQIVCSDLLYLVDTHVCQKTQPINTLGFYSLVKGQAISGADLCMAVSSSPL